MPDNQKVYSPAPTEKDLIFVSRTILQTVFFRFLREPTLEVHMSPYMSEYGLGLL